MDGEAKPALNSSWPLLALACVALSAGIGGYFATNAVPEPGGIHIAKSSETAITPAVSPDAQPAKPDEIDVSAAIKIADLSSCTFSEEPERAFSRLLQFSDTAQDWKAVGNVTVSGMRLNPTLNVTAAEDVTRGGRIIESSVRFPSGTFWNGLRITRLVARHGDFPYIDDFDSRSVNFAESPSRLAARLRGLGYSVPVEPEYLDLSTGEDVCGGSMQIESISGGSALVCSWGC